MNRSTLKKSVRGLIRRAAPKLDQLLYIRNQRSWFKKAFSERQRQNKTRIYGELAPIILSGPFKNMKYLDETVWGPIEPKWAGTYESELHRVINSLSGYKRIVDVGSADGYYSVGLARRFPSTPVFSFDTDPWARAQQRRLAKMNNVENITFGGFCSSERLEQLSEGRSLIICDIEGFEYGFLKEGLRVRSSDILVELHEDKTVALDPFGGADLLRQRFAQTHSATVINSKRRTIDDAKSIPALTALSSDEALSCVDEIRGYDQCWIWLQAEAN